MKALSYQLRKKKLQAKHAFVIKKNHRESTLLSELSSPAAKASVSRLRWSANSPSEQAHQLFVQIGELLQTGTQDDLLAAVDSLKTLFVQANNEKDMEATNLFYEAITEYHFHLLCRLLTPGTCEKIQIKAVGIFVEIAYSKYSRLIVSSDDALEKIIATLYATNKAIRLRAVGCIANLAVEGNFREYLLSKPRVMTGLIRNLELSHKTIQDAALVMISCDTCWAVNNLISMDSASGFAKIQPFLHPLVQVLALMEQCSVVDRTQLHFSIRYGVRALEKGFDMARKENISCPLLQNKLLIHFLSVCMRYRRDALTRDIAITAMNCMRHFALKEFADETFVTDATKTLNEERQLRSGAVEFLSSWCVALGSMTQNGLSNQMSAHIITRLANGLASLTDTKWSWPHELRTKACEAMAILGASLRNPEHVRAFWISKGGSCLVTALQLDSETAVHLQALAALHHLVPANPSQTSSFLLPKRELQEKMIAAVEHILEQPNDVTHVAATAVSIRLEALKDWENEEAPCVDLMEAKIVPSTKRRRVELGAYNA
ncbi:hypothetical protein FisN_7Lh362 [Fistulifera solaris]|uniref:Uncharacterized protein n=1 Tax=Fistulifera solaris TaxID=1519565 RepID=A0A1Z5JBB1_FISSO|nr:hypothetical protein FisN_7Lh362 [Fistulifera solaris]|eukprot:GAX11265.1 hypothetical protein FisN_7Lh362 [Fistulifera solaris]